MSILAKQPLQNISKNPLFTVDFYKQLGV